MSQRSLLLVDDNKENLRSLELCFARSDYDVIAALGGDEAIKVINNQNIDVVVTDLSMPEIGGIEVLKAAKKLNPPAEVILLTAYGTIESAVDAMHEGALDYLTKPINMEEIRQKVSRAMERQNLIDENRNLREQVQQRFGFEEIIGEHQSMKDLFDKIRTVANSRATVLIDGESGTGKELVARAIHYNSPRANQSFIPVHCAALTDSLLESELFGHEKGAFTGADDKRIGRFERADNGSLFLDEISEIPLTTQVTLLRVLESREFERVGGIEPIRVDVRLIAATNRSLEQRVRDELFREDLFYRLNVVHLRIPPLRERISDIPLLVNFFLKHFSEEHGKSIPTFSRKAMSRLMAWSWPGNVRELRNAIENLIIFNNTDTIEEEDLPFNNPLESDSESINLPIGQNLDFIEREYIRRSLLHHSGNVTHTAEALGIGRRTLQRKMKEWGLDNLLDHK